MSKEAETRTKIVEGAIRAFNEKGIKFTMDDVASLLGMSKKTLYKQFKSKDEMVMAAVDLGFGAVKESEQAIIDDDSLDIVEKIRRVIVVIPDRYQTMDWRRLYEFQDVYPEAYARIQYYLETGWEGTLGLLEEGIRQGRIRRLPLPVLQSMLQSSFEGFIRNDALVEAGISYEEALEIMIDVVMRGICA